MKNFALTLVLLIAAGFGSMAHAATYAGIGSEEFQLNRAAPNAMQKNQLGTLITRRVGRLLKCRYDFSVQGGAVGTLSLLAENGQACQLPNNALVVQAIIDNLVTATSGGSATIAVGTGAATNDLKAATAFGSYTGILAGIPVHTAATAIKLAADQQPTMTIATAALTAGKFNVLIEYLISD